MAEMRGQNMLRLSRRPSCCLLYTSTDSEKVDSFSTGKVLTILETLDGWYKVEEGYVSADYVTIIDAAEAASSGSASEVEEPP